MEASLTAPNHLMGTWEGCPNRFAVLQSPVAGLDCIELFQCNMYLEDDLALMARSWISEKHAGMAGLAYGRLHALERNITACRNDLRSMLAEVFPPDALGSGPEISGAFALAPMPL